MTKGDPQIGPLGRPNLILRDSTCKRTLSFVLYCQYTVYDSKH